MKKNLISISQLFVILIPLFFFSCTDVQNEEPGLKDYAQTSFHIGAAINLDQITGKDSLSQKLIIKEFNTISPENELKPMYIQPNEGEFNFDISDKYVEFGEKNNMFIVGHTLIWHQQTPSWVFKNKDGDPASEELLLSRMKNHIQALAGRYKGRINGWDVVNEAILDDGTYRKSEYYNILGEEFIEKAFEFAYEADPEAELYYNDYSLTIPAKREGVIRMIKSLQSKGVKVTGVGMQAHYDLYGPEISEFEKSIIEFNKLGLDVMITEMDISALPSPWNFTGAEISASFELQDSLNPYKENLPDSMQNKLADRYAEFFSVMKKHEEKISRVTFWGVSDAFSWKNDFPIRGRTDYPLLFDRNYQPKPAYEAVKKVLLENK